MCANLGLSCILRNQKRAIMKNKFLLLILISIAILNCENDDESDSGIITIPERDRAEQQIEDNNLLLEYFDTHYYNSSELAGIANPKIGDIIISEDPTDISGNPNTLLSTSGVLSTRTINYEETDYTYYILNLSEGGGDETPHFCDNIRTNYSGNFTDGEVFDSTVNPITVDLLNFIKGWQIVIPEFKTAESFTVNTDGTIDYINSGLGVMFMPSGLGYFSTPPPGISLYTNLIFKFELLETTLNDHDGDNVFTFIEDLNGDLDLTNEDTDDDTFLNAFDSDDDGDGVPTINEDLEDMDLIVDADGDGDPTNDKQGDGDPTNDDTDGDGIPNYLDTDDSETNDN